MRPQFQFWKLRKYFIYYRGAVHVWRSEVSCESQFSPPLTLGPRDHTQIIRLARQAILLALHLYRMACKCSVKTSLRVRLWRASCSFPQFYRITRISQTLNCLEITDRLKRLNKINIQMTINLDNVILIWWTTYRDEWHGLCMSSSHNMLVCAKWHSSFSL